MVEDLEKDVGEWHHLSQSDLAPLIEEEFDRLSEHVKQTFIEMIREAEVVSQELKSLEAEKITIANVIDASNQALASANDQIENARQRIARANVFLSKVKPVCEAETGQLERMTARSIYVQ